MTFVFIVALVEFAIAVFFYAKLKQALREIEALASDNENLEAILQQDSDERDAEHSRRFDEMLGTILNNTELLMSKLDDLKADLADYFAKAQADHDDLKAQVEALKNQPAGVSDADLQAVMDSIDAAKAKIAPVAAAVAAPVVEAAPAPADVPAAPAQ